MIEVEADILRGSCTPVFFVGEEIKCEIKFRSLTKTSDVKNQDDTKLHMSESMFSILSNQSLASSAPSTPIMEPKFFTKREINQENENFVVVWSCAQIDCNCFIDDSKVMLPKDPLRYSIVEKAGDSSVTSFQPNKDRLGISIFSSKPKILFCNLILRPGEEKSFIYSEKLPYDLAPTFRGQFARYSYKLTIGVQKLNGSTQLLRLPFRVYSLMDFDKYIPSMANLGGEYDYTEKRDSIVSQSADVDSFDSSYELPNPFKIDEKNGYEELEYALQVLEDLTARMNSFNDLVFFL
ncbi:RAB6A-GEF complex partner 2-like isoform X1 [Brachionus plicatilis]|uniref:RAB6A-GEF complex partner 2-like isoform X1 n=1 Tax=Brachionus plicatilis TaxID=10195 RepID=A0A3M7S1J4_BRAPC|nr:RAB6A-GEF complex partner 2-like isoform X1 [Brachionus plicatilis]